MASDRQSEKADTAECRQRQCSRVQRVLVEHADDPRLEPFRHVRERTVETIARGVAVEATVREGPVLAEGEVVLRRVVQLGRRVVAALCTPAKADAIEELLRAQPAPAMLLVASPVMLERITGFAFHRGVLALVERGTPVSVADVARSASRALVMENISDPANIGALFRTLAALGGPRSAAVLSPGCADPMLRRCVRTSMAHVFAQPYAIADPWPRSLGLLADAGMAVVGMVAQDGGRAISVRDLEPALGGRRAAVLLGAEGPGLTDAALERCELRCHITMAGGVDSLNVVVAAGIVLHALACGA